MTMEARITVQQIRNSMPAFEAKMRARQDARIKFIPRSKKSLAAFKAKARQKHASRTEYLADVMQIKRCPSA